MSRNTCPNGRNGARGKEGGCAGMKKTFIKQHKGLARGQGPCKISIPQRKTRAEKKGLRSCKRLNLMDLETIFQKTEKRMS